LLQYLRAQIATVELRYQGLRQVAGL